MNKEVSKFPIVDFIVKRMGIKNRKLYDNRLLNVIRKLPVPIIGYYQWEIVLR